MARKNSSSIISVFGICECTAAEMFIERGIAKKIARHNFVEGAPVKPNRFNAPDGKTRCCLCFSTPDECKCDAAFAVVIKERDIPAFDKLVRELRA